MPPDRDLRALGGPLSASEGAYLQSELEQRGIEARLREEKDRPGRVRLKVGPDDFAKALRIREELFDTPAETDPKAGRDAVAEPSAAARRRRSLLTAAVGAIAVLYVGRRISPRLAGLAAILVGLGLYFALTPRSDRDE